MDIPYRKRIAKLDDFLYCGFFDGTLTMDDSPISSLNNGRARGLITPSTMSTIGLTTRELADMVYEQGAKISAPNYREPNRMYIRSVNDLTFSTHEIYIGEFGNGPEVVDIYNFKSVATPEDIVAAITTIADATDDRINRVYEVSYADEETDDIGDYMVTHQYIFVLGFVVFEVIQRPKNLCVISLAGSFYKDKFAANRVILKDMLRNDISTEEKQFYAVSQTRDGFELEAMSLDNIKFDADLIAHNYNDNFVPVNLRIQQAITEKHKGLILLHGEPGTGKTSYIKQLIAMQKKRKLVLIPPHMTGMLSSPQFVSFVKEELADHILVIEDGETVLHARDSGLGDASAVANLLNITDGILGDALNILVICTFNTSVDKIDPALMRKGRLIAEYFFGKLEVEKVKELASTMYDEVVVSALNAPMSLADLYNYDVEVFKTAEKVKGNFGFNQS